MFPPLSSEPGAVEYTLAACVFSAINGVLAYLRSRTQWESASYLRQTVSVALSLCITVASFACLHFAGKLRFLGGLLFWAYFFITFGAIVIGNAIGLLASKRFTIGLWLATGVWLATLYCLLAVPFMSEDVKQEEAEPAAVFACIFAAVNFAPVFWRAPTRLRRTTQVRETAILTVTVCVHVLSLVGLHGATVSGRYAYDFLFFAVYLAICFLSVLFGNAFGLAKAEDEEVVKRRWRAGAILASIYCVSALTFMVSRF